MAKTRTPEFDAMYNGVPDEKIDLLIEKIKARQKIYLIIWIVGALVGGAVTALIPVIGPLVLMALIGISMGFYIYCYNTICFLESRGFKKSGGIISFLLAFLGGIIVPILVLMGLGKVPKLGTLVLGV